MRSNTRRCEIGEREREKKSNKSCKRDSGYKKKQGRSKEEEEDDKERKNGEEEEEGGLRRGK